MNDRMRLITHNAGRNIKNDIPLDDATVSNYHCEIMYEEIYNSHYFFIKGMYSFVM